MNDKEKLISFINKGKENKPVKEVHVIKDSPTEAHILLVNEDGTNVASNRFEIMDAYDLMTLIENPVYSGLYIDISEDNKKVVFKVDKSEFDYTLYNENIYVFTAEEQAQYQELYSFLNFFQNLEDNCIIRGRFYETDVKYEEGLFTITFETFIQQLYTLLINGFYEGKTYFSIGYDTATDNLALYSIGNSNSVNSNEYAGIYEEYGRYKQATGKEIYLSVSPIF